MPGLSVRPVRSALAGWITSPSFIFSSSAISLNAFSMVSFVNGSIPDSFSFNFAILSFDIRESSLEMGEAFRHNTVYRQLPDIMRVQPVKLINIKDSAGLVHFLNRKKSYELFFCEY